MSDDILSQEEIEALLSGKDLDDFTMSNDDSTVIEADLSELERDTIGEIANISFGSSATALSSLLGQKVEITTPTISIIKHSMLEEEFALPYVAIKVEYTQGLRGMNLFVIKQSDASIIADLMLGGDGSAPNPELGDIHLSAVQEAMNQMMGSAATSMSSVFNVKVDISPPTIDLMDVQEKTGVDNIPAAELLIKVAFTLKVGDLIDSEIMQVIPYEFGKEMVGTLLNDNGVEEVAAATTVVAANPFEETPAFMEEPKQAVQPEVAPRKEEPVTHQKPQVAVEKAQFSSFEQGTLSNTESQNLDILLDIPLQVTVELGRTKRTVQEILELSSGSIIELDKLVGEPVDILVNNRLIANGEVVVIDEKFGVRITDVLSPKERINNLR
ncbi:flagellar motor switch phosphatase FliY [Sporosarcina ureilytica]|uniref:Flagellar motor switch phosphatase FliY n=1 Tax=Sporosarcina ureilytica TaxID=298596 RepID=A0A1D8JKJ3_9BACL|nr:flagellar motor switch phosphatase FliY [Sporosarcina ureilytica]AOV09234.1 flagellar motor switch phosphatase FliY [Sporosarcina ureilytica]